VPGPAGCGRPEACFAKPADEDPVVCIVGKIKIRYRLHISKLGWGYFPSFQRKKERRKNGKEKGVATVWFWWRCQLVAGGRRVFQRKKERKKIVRKKG
jgi:hypothetical protein